MKKFPLDFSTLKKLVKEYPTPFYLYDEQAIRENIRSLYNAFSWNTGFLEFFAVKATPNPYILDIFREEHCGVDCSSLTELILADSCAFPGEKIMFTSNVTPAPDFKKAKSLNAIINLDDISHINFLRECAGIPELICFRLNPGGIVKYQDKTILNYEDHKFGFTLEQFIEGVNRLKTLGIRRFGLHSQFGCHRTESEYFEENVRSLFQKVVEIHQKTGIHFEFINLAGGLGIPYLEDTPAPDINEVGCIIHKAYDDILGAAGLTPIPLYLELGIFMTGPYGYFVSSVLHVKETYKKFLGLDASTNCFMSPSRYSNYHFISVPGKEMAPADCIYDITGALCEDRDRFAVKKNLPHMEAGDLLVFHDAGAYTYAQSNHFNGKLKTAELLLRPDGSIQQIRRAETPSDYFNTLDYPIKYE